VTGQDHRLEGKEGHGVILAIAGGRLPRIHRSERRTLMQAVPIAGLCSMATRQLLAELAPAYGQQTGRPVALTSVGGADALRRVQNREPFDFVVLAADAIGRLGKEGHVDPGSRADVARSGAAVAVKAGAPHPDLTTGDAVRQAVLSARKVGYSTGPSGVYLARLFERWGIAETIAARLVQAPPGVPVGTLVASGEVELGFQQLSELVGLPGIDIVGPLPPDIQVVTVFSAACCSVSTRAEDVAAFFAFLTRSEADDVKRRHGLEPA
jgi:molybdate transport system substrate-binding protein